MKQPKEKPRANIRVPKGAKVKMEGFSDLGPDKDITVILKGRVAGFSDNPDMWDPGRSFNLDMTSCRIVAPGVKVTLSDAMKKAERRV